MRASQHCTRFVEECKARRTPGGSTGGSDGCSQLELVCILTCLPDSNRAERIASGQPATVATDREAAEADRQVSTLGEVSLLIWIWFSGEVEAGPRFERGVV